MPIVDRSITTAPSAAGTIMASFLAIDGTGREWRRSRSRFANIAAAEAASDAYDWTSQLENLELQRATEAIGSGTDPDDFVLTLTELRVEDFETRIMLQFATSELTDTGDDYMLNIATWVAAKTVLQIETILSTTTARATTVRDRAIRIRDDIKPAVVLDRGDVIKDGG